MANSSKHLYICLDNSGYEVALERRKIYVALPDAKAEKLGAPYSKRPDNARLMTPTPPPVAYPKFCLSLEEQQVLQADCLPYCEPVTATVPARRVPRCRDPFDLPFLSLALAGTIVKPAQLRTRLGIT